MTRLLRYTLQLTFFACLVCAQPVWAQKGGKPKNNPPVAQDDAATVVQGNTVVIPVLDNDSDLDDDPLTVQSVRRAKGVVHIQDDSTLLYRPTPNFVGEDAFEYTISDGNKGKASARVRVQVRAAQANFDPIAGDDEATTDEDTQVTVAVLSNDSDPDEDALTITGVTPPANGIAAISGSDIIYTPNENFNGSDSFTYTVSDGNGGSASATVTVSVKAINDAPVITSPATATAIEDELFTYTATASDVDNPSVDIAISALSDWLTADGSTVSGTPTEGVTSGSFTITASDGELTAVLDVTVTVGQVNDPPLAVNDAATTDEDTPVTISVLANDSDPDEDALSVKSVSQPDSGLATIKADGTVTYAPDENFNGSDGFTYTIIDGKGGSASAGVTITVNPVNDAPVAVADAFSVPEDSPVRTLDVLANDIDVDRDDLIITNFMQANGILHIINSGKHLSYEPTPNFSGEDVFYYTVRDAAGAEDEAQVTVIVGGVNDAPVFTSSPVTTAAEGSVYTYNISASDDDAGAELTISAATKPTWLDFADNGDGTALLSGTPGNADVGDHDVVLTLTDGVITTPVEQSFTITVSNVNDVPVFTSSPVTTAAEGSVYTYNISASDADADAELTISAATLPGWLDFTDNGDGTALLTGTPGNADVGDHDVVLTLTDGIIAAPVEQTFTITVSNVNEDPVAVDDEASTDGNSLVIINVLDNDVDADVGDVLSVASVTQGANGSVVINLDGTVTYTPNENFSGSDNFTYTVSDNNGGSATATVTVLVNLAGDLAANVPVDPNEGDIINTDIGVYIEILPQNSPGETVNIQIGTYDEVPPGAPDLAGILYFFGPSGTTFDPPATITVPYDPDLLPEGFDPADLVLLIYSESDGTWEEALNSVVDTDAETVSGQTTHFSGFAAGLLLDRAPQLILSLPEPVIEEDAQSTVIIENLNDYFADPNFGDQVDFDATSLDIGLHRVIVTDEAELIVDPQPNFYGEVRIVITATDLTELSTSDTLFLTVTADNDPPFFPPGFHELLADFMTINEDQALRIPLMADDVEGDDVTFHAASDTSGVTTLVQDTTLLVVPIQDWFGTAHITISASDGQDTTHLDPLTLTIESVNDPPSAFELLAPDIDALLKVETSQLGDFLTFTWKEVIDPDDSVNYTFTLSDTGAIYFEYDTTTTATEVRVPYADIVSAITNQDLKTATFEWTVVAIAGQDIIEASNGPNSLTIDINTLAVMDESHLPQFFALHQNYPNPFNPVTTLRYELPTHCQVLLAIYDMRGREVVRLVDGYESAGYNRVTWNSGDAFGRPAPSGIYFARLITPEYTQVIKMSLIR